MSESYNIVAARGSLDEDQRQRLLAPLNPNRVSRKNQFSYLAQHDVRAMLIRILGFGRFDLEVIDTHVAFETEDANRWNVAYRVTARLTVYDRRGLPVCVYTESALAEAQNQPQRGEAHDQALKSAASDEMKRCAVNLGDQFGLSLYNNGSTRAFVIETLEDKATISESETPDPDPALSTLVETIRFLGMDPNPGTRTMALSEIRMGLDDETVYSEVEFDGRTVTIGRIIEAAAEGKLLVKEPTP